MTDIVTRLIQVVTMGFFSSDVSPEEREQQRIEEANKLIKPMKIVRENKQTHKKITKKLFLNIDIE